MTVQTSGVVPRIVPREDQEVVDEWMSRILDVVGPNACVDGDPAESCRTAAEAAEELSAYLWILIRRHGRTV